MKKVKIHDGIVGALILACVVVGFKVSVIGYYVAGGLGALMISSAFTGFCPVYFLLNKLMPDDKPAGP